MSPTMELELRRLDSSTESTLGALYIDGEFQCFTLEDRVRQLFQKVFMILLCVRVRLWRKDMINATGILTMMVCCGYAMYQGLNTFIYILVT